MSLPWITINSRLQSGVSLINSVNNHKFTLLLKHIQDSKSDEIFTEEELEKLCESLKLDRNSLQLLILSISHILKQSSRVILKPTVLQDQLVEHLKFDAEKAEIFVRHWASETKKDFDLEKSKKLENISWELNLQTASSVCNKEAYPNARIQMALSGGGESSSKENFVLELGEEELVHFYSLLENIQNKLDSM